MPNFIKFIAAVYPWKHKRHGYENCFNLYNLNKSIWTTPNYNWIVNNDICYTNTFKGETFHGYPILQDILWN